MVNSPDYLTEDFYDDDDDYNYEDCDDDDFYESDDDDSGNEESWWVLATHNAYQIALSTTQICCQASSHRFKN